VISRIKTIYVPADDVASVSAFYEQMLGLKPRFRDGDRWVQFSVGDTGFAVASRDESAKGADGPVVVFEATDSTDHKRILTAGATPVAERDMGSHGRTRTYRGPGGALIQLFWRAAS
jgi:predicted enzyme related to lactoylglutathione lyase